LKPHLVRYWLTPVVDEQLDEKVSDINQLYQQAPRLVEQGEAVVSTDELTGVQALERKHETLPMKAGIVEYQGFEYKPHGTQSFIVNFMVATGEIGTVSHGSTRNETNFLNHVRAAVQAHPEIRKWHFIVDNLNTHCSESLVRFVADESDIASATPTPLPCSITRLDFEQAVVFGQAFRLRDRPDFDVITRPAYRQIGQPVVLGFTATSADHHLPAAIPGQSISFGGLSQRADLIHLEQ